MAKYMKGFLSFPLGSKLLMKTLCRNKGGKRQLLLLHVWMICSMMTNCATHGGMIRSHRRPFGSLVETWIKLTSANTQNHQATTRHGHSLMDGMAVQTMECSYWTCWKNNAREPRLDSRKRLL
ncbi:unnamed protein product [Prunus armeniaca]